MIKVLQFIELSLTEYHGASLVRKYALFRLL